MATDITELAQSLKAPASKETRAALMVERIESHNSPGSLTYCEQRDRFDMQLQLAV